MKIVYLDTETTGLDRQKQSIIQLAGVIEDTATGKTDDFNYRLRPYTKADWEENAWKTHHITPDIADLYPDQGEAYRAFKALLKTYVDPYNRGDKIYVCGYNVQFDIDFMINWFKFNRDNYFFSFFHSSHLTPLYHKGLTD